MNYQKNRLPKGKPALAINNKQQLKQVSKISQSDEYIPKCEEEEEDECDNPSGLLTHIKPQNLSQEGVSYFFSLSIKQQDICHSIIVQLLDRADLNKLRHFSLDLAALINKQSTFLLLSNLLSKLTALTSFELIIKENELEDASAKQLSYGFQAIKDLRSLKFNMYQCNSKQRKIGLLQEEKIIASTIFFTTSGFQMIYQTFGEYIKLQQLELIIGRNDISENEILILSKSLNKLRGLTSLVLCVKEENMKSPGLETMVTSISKMVLLENLKLSLIDCRLTSSHCSSILLSFQHLVNLKHFSLILDVEEFQKKQLLFLAQKFRNFKRLLTLEFAFPILCFYQQLNFRFNGLGHIDEQNFEELIRLTCIKNAKRLVKFKMGTLNSLEY